MHLWKDDGGDEERQRDIPAIGLIQQRFTLPPTVSDPHLKYSSLKSIPWEVVQVHATPICLSFLPYLVHVHEPEPFHDQMQKNAKIQISPPPLFRFVPVSFRQCIEERHVHANALITCSMLMLDESLLEVHVATTTTTIILPFLFYLSVWSIFFYLSTPTSPHL